MKPLPLWIDGRLYDPREQAFEAEDPSNATRESCYTSALVQGGQARWAERHVARLLRDTAALGLPVPRPDLVRQAFSDLGRSCFGDGAGIVRLEARASQLVGTPRPLENTPGDWRAFTHATPHPGPGPWPGVKRAGDPFLASARSACLSLGLDEAILADGEGYVLEGSRSGLVVLDAAGDLVTPDPRRGGVRSIGLEILGEALPELTPRDLPLETLWQAREVIAVNAVRGAQRVRTLDQRALGPPSGSGLASRLAEVLEGSVG